MIRSTAAPFAHGGERLYTISSDLELLHIVRGSVTVIFSSHEVELHEGDTLSFVGREPHTWRAHADGAELVWTLIPAAWRGSNRVEEPDKRASVACATLNRSRRRE